MVLEPTRRWWQPITLLAGLAISGVIGFGLAQIKGRPTIELNAAAIAQKRDAQAAGLGRSLSPAENQALIDSMVNQEVLVREAAALGIHLKNADVRKHLVLAMEHVLAVDVPQPSDANLASLQQRQPERYMTPETVTFEHIFFKTDEAGAEALAQDLARGEVASESAGDAFWLGRHMENYGYAQLLAVLGPGFTASLKDLPIGQWAGPVQSGRGWHLVRVESFQGPIQLPEADLNRRLLDDWARDYRITSLDRQLASMKKKYQIQVPEASKTPGLKTSIGFVGKVVASD